MTVKAFPHIIKTVGIYYASVKKHAFVSSPVLLFQESRIKSYFRACTGFDGGFEVREAIRRLLDCVPTGNLNINADEQLALAA